MPLYRFLDLLLSTLDSIQLRAHEQVLREECQDIGNSEEASKEANQGRTIKQFNDASDFKTL